MAPEYGATCGIFPVDDETLRYLELTGRPDEQIALVEAYAKAQGLWRTDGTPEAALHRRRSNSTSARSSRASPARSARRIACRCASPRRRYRKRLGDAWPAERTPRRTRRPTGQGSRVDRRRQDVRRRRTAPCVIAAITSCTNTSNPSVMIAAGLLARKAVAGAA